MSRDDLADDDTHSARGLRSRRGKLWAEVVDEHAEFFDAIASLGTKGSEEGILEIAGYLEGHAKESDADLKGMLHGRGKRRV